jgi:hypothetical protein
MRRLGAVHAVDLDPIVVKRRELGEPRGPIADRPVGTVQGWGIGGGARDLPCNSLRLPPDAQMMSDHRSQRGQDRIEAV